MITPYYDHAGITIYHGDCREILPTLTGIDAIVTDPPYGVGMTSFEDNFRTSIEGLRLCPGKLAAVFMSPRRIVELSQAIAPQWRYERALWMDKSADIAHAWHGWFMHGEVILIYSRKGAKWPKTPRGRSDLYQVGPLGNSGHPNRKPLFVVRDLVQRMTQACVCDPFMGGGTTLRAAKDLGLTAIGIEIEERYCELAARRLQQEVLPLGDVA